MQEEFQSLAEEATRDVMAVIKSEKYLFTNNGNYMKTLNKMKAYVLRKNGEFYDPAADARDASDEVECLQML